MPIPVPAYFDYLIAAYHQGQAGHHVHLGYWDPIPAGDTRPTSAEFEQAQHALIDQLIGQAHLTDEQLILDVGCGFGGTLATINPRFHRMQLHGVNIDPRQLAICAAIRPDNDNTINLTLADATTLPYADESMDRIFCVEAMFHFRSRRVFLQEAARILRPGGLLITTDILLTARLKTGAIQELVESMLDAYGPWPDPWGTDADFRQLATDSGLNCISIDDVSAQTMPSHQFTAPAYTDPPILSGDPARDAALAMQWLHQQGILRYLFLVFTR